MDGIVTGLTSIVPIMPDQSIIADRSGVNGPPVEIMPLPTNSFMSDEAAAELLNNPFTLSLDKDGRGSGAAGGGKAVDTASRSGRTADALTAGAMLEEAYTLSLGNEENAPVAAEIVREMSRMKSYELLGKSAARRAYRKPPETGNTGYAPAPLQEDGSAGPIGDMDRSLLSRLTAQQSGTGVQLPAQNGTAETIVQTLEPFLVPPDGLPEEAAGTRQMPQPGETPAEAGARQDLSLLSNLHGVQLSASDIEAILTLEPELREALLNMLSGAGTDSSATPEDIAAFMNKTAQTQPGSVQEFVNDIPEAPNADAMARLENSPDDPRAAPLSDEELTRLAAGVLAGGKAQAAVLRGDMANLRKINELPYSLYIFGNVNARGKEETDEEFEIDAAEEPNTGRMNTRDSLRLSEAVKMAAVLHNIYYGGSGRFPEETPWYAPYVRYAVKNGIIDSGEFGDYSEYATRAETAYIFSNCVPKAEFPILNYISDIPDVVESIGYGSAIYLLYRAGVLKKTGRNAHFYPERMITKTEAAVIIGRIATPEDRKLM